MSLRSWSKLWADRVWVFSVDGSIFIIRSDSKSAGKSPNWNELITSADTNHFLSVCTSVWLWEHIQYTSRWSFVWSSKPSFTYQMFLSTRPSSGQSLSVSSQIQRVIFTLLSPRINLSSQTVALCQAFVCLCVLKAAELVLCVGIHTGTSWEMSVWIYGLWQMVWGFGGLEVVCSVCSSNDTFKLLSSIYSSVCQKCLFKYQ